MNTVKKLEELIASNERLAELLHMKKEEPKKTCPLLIILAIIGGIAAIIGIIFAIRRYLCPVYLEDGELEDENSSDSEDFAMENDFSEE